MTLIYLLIIGFAPGVFWIWYFYKRDKFEPEPKSLVAKMFFGGVFVALPVAIVEYLLPFKGLSATIIMAPIVEEFFKFIIVWKFVFNNIEFDEPMDGIIYASAASLGFASIENFFYMITAYHNGNLAIVSIMRAFLSVPGHALFGCMWGYALGISKFYKVPKNFVKNGLFLAMIFHSIFNLSAYLMPVVSFGIIVFVLIAWRQVNKKINTLQRISPFI